MWKLRSQSKSSSSVEVDFLILCEENVRSIKELVKLGGNLLNQRQCQDLSSKLSKTIENIDEVVLKCGASADLFRPALENLYRYLEKAKVLVSECGEEDWCAAAVFQSQNENAFREILLDVSLCYNAVYEQAKSTSDDCSVLPEDLRRSSMFQPATDSDVHEDQQDLQNRLDDIASGYSEVELSNYFIPGRLARRQSLAKYLMVKMYCTSSQPQASTLEKYSAMLWSKVSEPLGTWGSGSFLGSGSGASGVCSTKWLGIPCAKKEFHGQEEGNEELFLKEAGILAHLKHPCIINFICCGNGQQRGDRFIAMELLEKNLFHLIEEQKSEYLSLPVVVDMLVQIARGVCYLHGRGVAHRDLKPQNVVVSRVKSPHLVDHFCVKLVDFGMSKTKVEVSKANTVSYRGVGTTMYRAPEVHPMANPNGGGKVNWFKADAFSFAMTCAHLLSLKIPFKDTKVNELYSELTKINRRPEIPSNCPEEIVALLRECWNTSPSSRPSFVEICRRLERFRHKELRGFSFLHKYLQEEDLDFSGGFEFINLKLKEESSSQRQLLDGTDDELEGEYNREEVVSTIPCTCGRELELLPRSPYKPGSLRCDICFEECDGEVYHCEYCQFDAHPNCAEIKDPVHVFFHDHPLHLLVQNYYSDDPDVTCRFCGESVQDSAWVYRCEQCEFDVHALCTKYPKEMMDKCMHAHSLRLIQCPPHKSLSCSCCTGKVRGSSWRYTCTEKSCRFELHLSCYIRSWDPLCIFDISHRLYLVKYQRGFHCGKCGELGLSCFYRCDTCDVDIHLECLDDMVEEEDYWIGVYKKFMLEYGSKDYHFKMDMISKLMERLFMSKSPEVNSSSSSGSPLVMMRVLPSIQRLTPSEEHGLDAFDDVNVRKRIDAETLQRKTKKQAGKQAWQKLKGNPLEMLENLERIVLDMESSMNMSQADAEVLVATHEKLKKGRYIVQEETARQVQSKMRQGPHICLFFQAKNGRGPLKLLSSLQADMKDVHFLFLCEEPGHEHIVQGSACTICNGVLGVERVGKLQPLLFSGLQVVMRTMSTLTGQQLQLDCMTSPNLGELEWDLRAMDLEKHGKRSREPFEEEENMEALKRAEDSAAEWILSALGYSEASIYEDRGLLRIRYLVTEVGDCPRYTRGTLAWLCADHVKGGLEADRLEPYPVKYYNEQR